MIIAEPLQRRRGFLALVAAVALAAALATGLFDTGHDASATSGERGTTHSHATAAAHTARQAEFQDEMRRLWEDHVTWTRLAIVTFVDGSASFDATAARLLKNQDDIGEAIKPFYGEAAGDQLTALLRDHILIAVELLKAARSGDREAFEGANTDWYANADEVADFLAAADPEHWPRDAMRDAMRAHLDQTLAEASHELTGDYDLSVRDYDEIHHHILEMADVLSSGIIRSFPRRFH
ncbi:MAG: hypothetical protein ACRDOM_05015 [Nocardioides sp.]